MGLVDHQVEDAGLMGTGGIALVGPAARPMEQRLFHQGADRSVGLQLGTEVEAAGEVIVPGPFGSAVATEPLG